MSYSVYEVELVSEGDGQRLFQHYKAETPEDAAAKVSTIQQKEVLGVSVRRPCTKKEEAAIQKIKDDQRIVDKELLGLPEVVK